MRQLFSLILFFSLFFPTILFAETPRYMLTPEYTSFSRYLTQMIWLGKYIDANQDVPWIIKIETQRQAIMDTATKIYKTFPIPERMRTTYDISSKYWFLIQKYRLSCEIAAVRMVMKSLVPSDVTEDDIIAKLRIMPGPLSSDGVWWDPDIGFVGSITGSQYMKTGYGIHEKPLERYLKGEWYIATGSNMFDGRNIIPRKRLIELFSSIESGKRVILWWDWCTTASMEDGTVKKVDTFIVRTLPISGINTCDRSPEDRQFTWTTPSGKTIAWLSWEHAFLLLGYIWSRENPTHIIVWDTDTGRHVYPYNEWMRKWWMMQYRSLTVSIKE